ncbi:MAG TPA: site-2 protease family protein [Gaiellaceae bacterium]|nr:site-2 protease family protein [Gaiellaceae bacterium]
MESTFRLGRVAGVEIGLNWSWLVVFALIVWSLTAGVFPDQNPGLADSTYLAMGVVAAVLFFASILLHELGHALQARREGMEIEGITLWLFGGVATFRGMFPSAGAEFRIAIAGPLVSLALGVLFSALAPLSELPAAVDGVTAWLGYINLALLVFNLLPALPLDGGRVLRALLWQARGDFGWATRIAAGAGRGFGYAFIGIGVALFIFQGAFSGAWLAFLGWFLLMASASEARYLATRQALSGLRVADLMAREPACVTPGMTLGEFMDEVAWSRRFTTYPVVEGERPVGLLPFRRVARVPRREWDARRVEECMVPLAEVETLRGEEPAFEAFQRLAENELGRGLVLEDGRLVGLLSVSDVARALEVGGPRRRRPR